MYKTTKFIFEQEERTGIWVRKYITVETGLTWSECKERREKDHSLQFVKT